jgi:hypothetical protein
LAEEKAGQQKQIISILTSLLAKKLQSSCSKNNLEVKANGVTPLTPQPIAGTQATEAALLSLGKSVRNSIDKFQNSAAKNECTDNVNLSLGKRTSLDILLKQCIQQKEKECTALKRERLASDTAGGEFIVEPSVMKRQKPSEDQGKYFYYLILFASQNCTNWN